MIDFTAFGLNLNKPGTVSSLNRENKKSTVLTSLTFYQEEALSDRTWEFFLPCQASSKMRFKTLLDLWP